MIHPARVIRGQRGSTRVAVHPDGCQGCAISCGRADPVQISLPGEYEGEVELIMTPRDQFIVLMNSLMIPLGGFLAGVLAGYLPGFPWFVQVALSLAGMLIGVWLCKAQNFDRLKVKEVLNQ